MFNVVERGADPPIDNQILPDADGEDQRQAMRRPPA
jgi:hypothetical protein